jgi:hypothetical protein
MLCLSYSLFLLFNGTGEKSAEQVLPGSEGSGKEMVEAVAGGRNNPNNVCTCE